jgi:hypothetical protein
MYKIVDMTSVKIKTIFLLNLFLALCGLFSLEAQTKNHSEVFTENRNNNELTFEKVYLHLDRSYYSSGDDIWFKAYLFNATTNKLSDNSSNLYVEIISPELKIIKRLILRMNNGLGFGDFHLEDSLQSGNYRVRAYTNWMRNFGGLFFLSKVIFIENQVGKADSDKPYKEQNNEKVDVQFFPEGGALIENVYTLIGFKAVNSLGFGCKIEGKVVSSKGDTIESFISTHLGMGSFFFLPKKNIKYFAEGYTENGIPFKVELPTAFETGYSIMVSDINSDYFRVAIKTNQETLDRLPRNEMIIIGTSHNSLCVTAKVKVKSIYSPVIIPKREFPEGISLITLMDTTGKAFSERAFYIHGRKNYYINIIPDKEFYTPRQKVTLQISVKDTSGRPVSADLSLSVVDGKQIGVSKNNSNIESYLLLESEVKGYVEQPDYYFDPAIPERYQELDNLLLTQGWRNFVWNYLSDTTIKFMYSIEKGITLSGKLKRKWIDKPIANANIYLAVFGKDGTSYKFTRTDSAGKYYFEGLDILGIQNILIYASNKNDLGVGILSLDSISKEPAPLNFDYFPGPEISDAKILKDIYANNFPEIPDYEEISKFREETKRKDDVLKKYHITDTILLNNVSINARMPVKENADGHFRAYGVPDFSLKVTDKMTSYPNAIQTIQGRVSGFYITGDSHTGYQFMMRGQKGTPLFLLDDKEVDERTIDALPVSAIDKIEVIKDGGKLAFYGMRGSYGVISVFTKRGINGTIPLDLNSLNVRICGYYQARTFYKPKYEVPRQKNEKPDLRPTIHWDPDIVTDKEGNATISFFSSDAITILKADVEGVAGSEFPVVAKANLEIK